MVVVVAAFFAASGFGAGLAWARGTKLLEQARGLEVPDEAMAVIDAARLALDDDDGLSGALARLDVALVVFDNWTGLGVR